VDFREIPVPYHEHLGLQVEHLPTESRITLPLGEHVRGAVAPLHGGVLCTLLDVACGAAVGASDDYDHSTTLPVSLSLTVDFLAQPRSGPLVAHGRVTSHDESGVLVEAEAVDGGGWVIGRARGTYRLVTGFGGHGQVSPG